MINADHLRAHEINISRQLSWERTALDFVWNLANNYKLSDLKRCSHLIVRFGLDGAIRYQKTARGGRVWLYYDPMRMEDGFQEELGQGKMMALASGFVAAFAGQIVQHSVSEHKWPGKAWKR